ncbi:MAG: NAD(P)H-dependent oxidoreductase [Verrucomicrobia bacterium]|nr:NAD(P)H-dependent oxidoreductase [Verrucomicrobiota bacterium]
MNHVIPESQLLDALNWRYATKTFDATKKIPEATWKALEETLVLSPSSFGLQPYRFLIVKDPAIRAQLKPHSWNQTQVVDASHYIVLAGRTAMTETEVDRFLDRVVEVRSIPKESLDGYRGMMYGSLLSPGAETRIPHWAALQAYIALGNLMTSAALLGVDTCAIEGFAPTEYDSILGLKEQGYASVVCCALGYRHSEDKHASAAKVRFPSSDLIKTI